MREDEIAAGANPAGAREDGRDRIGDEHQPEHQEHALGIAVAAQDDEPQTVRPAIGTLSWRLMCRSWIAAPIPADALTTSPVLATTSSPSANAVVRRLNCSPIRAPGPCPG